MARNRLRFCVTDGEKRASMWSIVAHRKKPEVYIFNRLLGTIHVSFHGSGKWHIKFGDIEEKKRVSINQEVEDVYMTKWERPDSVLPHVTIAFRIITLWGTPQKPMRTDKKDFIAIPNAKANHAIEVLILFVDADKEFVVKNATVIGSLTLSTGEQVFAVYAEIPATVRTPNIPKTIPDFSNRVSISDLWRGNTGMIFFGDASDGSRVMWDVALKIKPKAFVKIVWRKCKRRLSNITLM